MPRCPGCHADWPPFSGPTHRYIGASPACWALLSQIQAGVPPLHGAVFGASLIDAYCTQHPGVPSPQAIQSVAVHLVALHRRLEEGVGVEHLNRVRTVAVEAGRAGAVDYRWLAPPTEWVTNISAVVRTDETGRGAAADAMVVSVFDAWMSTHSQTIGEWSTANRRLFPTGRQVLDTP